MDSWFELEILEPWDPRVSPNVDRRAVTNEVACPFDDKLLGPLNGLPNRGSNFGGVVVKPVNLFFCYLRRTTDPSRV